MLGRAAAAEAEETLEDAGLQCRSLSASQHGFVGCVFSFLVVHKITCHPNSLRRLGEMKDA